MKRSAVAAEAAVPAADLSPETIPGPATYEVLPVASIRASFTNPRRHFDEAAMAELTDSVRRHGVVQPILVRPLQAVRDRAPGLAYKGQLPGDPVLYEIVAGERRWRATQAAGLDTIPATIRDLSNTDVLEIQVIENLQRADLHPLEEAQGYRQLCSTTIDVARIAERVGRSVKYVYDRMKLLDLTEEAQEMFLEDRFSAGHAILLARLKPEDQKRLVSPPNLDSPPPLFVYDSGLFDDGKEHFKPISVRELAAWIDEQVRLDIAPKAVDPMLFPETAQVIESAVAADEKLVPITYEHHVPPAAKLDGVRTYGPQSWAHADGQEWEDNLTGKPGKSKTCEFSVMGVIVIGERRGDSFRVCVNKDRCETHWGKKKRAAGATGSTRAADKERYDREVAKHRAESERCRVEQERWQKASPAIAQALAERVAKMPVKPGGLIANTLLRHMRSDGAETPKVVGVGETPVELLRHLAYLAVCDDCGVGDGWSMQRNAQKACKAFGVDAKKILAKAAPAEKPAKATPKKATTPETPREHIAKVKKGGKAKRGKGPSTAAKAGATCRSCGCTDDAACDGGCTWVEPDLCSSCEEAGDD